MVFPVPSARFNLFLLNTGIIAVGDVAYGRPGMLRHEKKATKGRLVVRSPCQVTRPCHLGMSTAEKCPWRPSLELVSFLCGNHLCYRVSPCLYSLQYIVRNTSLSKELGVGIGMKSWSSERLKLFEERVGGEYFRPCKRRLSGSILLSFSPRTR